MVADILEIDIKVLNRSVNSGLRIAKENTPVVTSFMRKSWRSTPAVKTKNGALKSLVNTADYSEFVNYGHRLTNKAGETVGWVSGRFILEKAMAHIEKRMPIEFKSEVERVNRAHDS